MLKSFFQVFIMFVGFITFFGISVQVAIDGIQANVCNIFAIMMSLHLISWNHITTIHIYTTSIPSFCFVAHRWMTLVILRRRKIVVLWNTQALSILTFYNKSIHGVRAFSSFFCPSLSNCKSYSRKPIQLGVLLIQKSSSNPAHDSVCLHTIA